MYVYMYILVSHLGLEPVPPIMSTQQHNQISTSILPTTTTHKPYTGKNFKDNNSHNTLWGTEIHVFHTLKKRN